MRSCCLIISVIGLLTLIGSNSYADFSQNDWCFCSIVFNDKTVMEKGFWATDKNISDRWMSSHCKNVISDDFVNFKVKSLEPGIDIPPYTNGVPIDLEVNSIKACEKYALNIIYMSTDSEEKLHFADASSALSPKPQLTVDSSMEEAESVCRGAIIGYPVSTSGVSWVVTDVELKQSRRIRDNYFWFAYAALLETPGNPNKPKGLVFNCSIELSNGNWLYKLMPPNM
jgi:hypothetical protein